MSYFTRSVVPILRTGRLALRHQRSVNPIQQVFAHDRNGVRGLATVFERNKPHVNIGTPDTPFSGIMEPMNLTKRQVLLDMSIMERYSHDLILKTPLSSVLLCM